MAERAAASPRVQLPRSRPPKGQVRSSLREDQAPISLPLANPRARLRLSMPTTKSSYRPLFPNLLRAYGPNRRRVSAAWLALFRELASTGFKHRVFVEEEPNVIEHRHVKRLIEADAVRIPLSPLNARFEKPDFTKGKSDERARTQVPVATDEAAALCRKVADLHRSRVASSIAKLTAYDNAETMPVS